MPATIESTEMITEPEHDSPMSIVAVENVHKRFDEHVVLDGMSLSVKAGETMAVLGRSGTGKSVLLRLIIGLTTPDTGTVSVLGKNLDGLSLDELNAIRMKMGFLVSTGCTLRFTDSRRECCISSESSSSRAVEIRTQ